MIDAIECAPPVDGDTKRFGMDFIEAASCGTPTITGISDETRITEIETGYRIDGIRLHAEVDALQHLLSDEPLGSSTGQTGHRHATTDSDGKLSRRQIAWKWTESPALASSPPPGSSTISTLANLSRQGLNYGGNHAQ